MGERNANRAVIFVSTAEQRCSCSIKWSCDTAQPAGITHVVLGWHTLPFCKYADLQQKLTSITAGFSIKNVYYKTLLCSFVSMRRTPAGAQGESVSFTNQNCIWIIEFSSTESKCITIRVLFCTACAAQMLIGAAARSHACWQLQEETSLILTAAGAHEVRAEGGSWCMPLRGFQNVRQLCSKDKIAPAALKSCAVFTKSIPIVAGQSRWAGCHGEKYYCCGLE